MKKLVLLFISVGLLVFTACEKYEDFLYDFEYSATYFSLQKPVRTLVESDNMSLKVGVALGGKRENNVTETVTFQIQDTLLNGTNFTLLPEEFYTLSHDSLMIVPKGEYMGLVEVDLNEEAFMTDPLSHEYTYALPLRITNTTADSTLANAESPWDGKDYTIVVIKYINNMHGYYYHKGVEYIDSVSGGKDTIDYNLEEIVRNEVWLAKTTGKDTVMVNGVGSNTGGNYKMDLVRDETGELTIRNIAGSSIDNIEDLGSSFDQEDSSFSLNYKWVDTAGHTHTVEEELIFRNDGIQFEEW
ncbi:DUF1735 domain-containing protein [Labilibacter sediminis]|nr:DUF1735 domain-containing protein [Labilibacter sediminis]